jgi:hypothetical protein
MNAKQDHFFAELDFYLDRGYSAQAAIEAAVTAYNNRFLEAPPSTRTHSLKTWPKYFRAIIDGSKKFELRKNDRDFHVGDTLKLEEWDAVAEEYTGRTVLMRVTYLIQGEFGLPEDMCIMSICDPEEAK